IAHQPLPELAPPGREVALDAVARLGGECGGGHERLVQREGAHPREPREQSTNLLLQQPVRVPRGGRGHAAQTPSRTMVLPRRTQRPWASLRLRSPPAPARLRLASRAVRSAAEPSRRAARFAAPPTSRAAPWPARVKCREASRAVSIAAP